MRKKLIKAVGLLGAALLIAICCPLPIHADTDTGSTEDTVDDVKSWNHFQYRVTDDNEIEICGYDMQVSDIVIPEKIENLPVTAIADKAFYKNEDISGCLRIGKNIKRIGELSFEYTNINSIIFEAGDTPLDVGEFAFFGLDFLQHIDFGTRTIQLHRSAFNNCDILTEVTIPATVHIEESCYGGFVGCDSLKKVTIEMDTISEDMFYDCENLQTVNITGNLKRIGAWAFYRCSSLTRINLPEGLTSIGKYAFAQCSTMEQIEIPDSVTTMGDYAFDNCRMLDRIHLPAGLTTLDRTMFDECQSMKQLTIDEDNPYYSSDGSVVYNKDQTTVLFGIKRGNEKLVLPDTVKEIEELAFLKCEKMQEIILPDGLETIGKRAFDNCTALERVVIPDSVQGTLEQTFHSCTGLTYVKIGSGVAALDATFSGCSELKEAVVPDSVQNFENGVFCNCEKLEKVRIPEGVKHLDWWTFYGCRSLTELKMPKSLESVGFRALQFCTSLKELTFYENLNEVNRIWYAMADNESLHYVFFRGPYVSLSDNVFTHMSEDFVVFYREKYPEWTQFTYYPTVAVTDAMLEMKDALTELDIAKVKLTDKSVLLDYQKRYEELTDMEQRLYLPEELEKLTQSLRKIYALEIEQKILKLPAAAKVKYTDKDEIRSVQREYQSLSESERNYIRAANRKKYQQTVAALNELLMVKEILPGTPVIWKNSSYQLTIAVGQKLMVPVTVNPEYAEDKTLYVETDGQDRIAAAKFLSEDELQIEGKTVGTTNVHINYQDRLSVPVVVSVTPAVPQNIKTTLRGENTVVLTWDRPEGAAYYMIYRKCEKEAEKLLAVTKENVGIQVDSNVTAGKTYAYRVVACAKESGQIYQSGFSAAASITLQKKEPVKPVVKKPAKPGKPSGVKVTASGKRAAKLVWKAPKNTTGYQIYRSTKKSSGFRKIKTIKKKTTVKYTNKKLAKKTYYYKIRAYHTSGKQTVYGSYSKTVKIKIKK